MMEDCIGGPPSFHYPPDKNAPNYFMEKGVRACATPGEPTPEHPAPASLAAQFRGLHQQ